MDGRWMEDEGRWMEGRWRMMEGGVRGVVVGERKVEDERGKSRGRYAWWKDGKEQQEEGGGRERLES